MWKNIPAPDSGRFEKGRKQLTDIAIFVPGFVCLHVYLSGRRLPGDNTYSTPNIKSMHASECMCSVFLSQSNSCGRRSVKQFLLPYTSILVAFESSDGLGRSMALIVYRRPSYTPNLFHTHQPPPKHHQVWGLFVFMRRTFSFMCGAPAGPSFPHLRKINLFFRFNSQEDSTKKVHEREQVLLKGQTSLTSRVQRKKVGHETTCVLSFCESSSWILIIFFGVVIFFCWILTEIGYRTILTEISQFLTIQERDLRWNNRIFAGVTFAGRQSNHGAI